jgi:glycosyltransferase involved in cell wall biosynthesis
MARTLAGLALRRMNARVVGACEFVAEPWRAYVAGERISVIFNGVAGPDAAHRRPSEGPPRIGCIGRIAPEKGQRGFVTAAARIHQSLPECRFAIYGSPLFGDAGSERYAAEVRDAAEGLTVEFPGWVTDVYGAMAELDLLLVPSKGPEATPRVIVEAFAAGLPVIALATGGIPEVVESGVTGLLAQSAEEMAQLAIVLLTGDPRRIISIVRAARAEWQRRFTQEHYHDQLLRTVEAAAISEVR